MPHVERSPAAEQDLFEIGVYITEQSGNEEIAYRFLDTIEFKLKGSGPRPLQILAT